MSENKIKDNYLLRLESIFAHRKNILFFCSLVKALLTALVFSVLKYLDAHLREPFAFSRD